MKAASVKCGETESEFVRRVLKKAVAEESVDEVTDSLLPIIRKSLREVLHPAEERLAKINAKTAIQSGSAYYLLLKVLELVDVDVRELKEEARKKAVADLRSRSS